jgi:hypothetical protein
LARSSIIATVVVLLAGFQSGEEHRITAEVDRVRSQISASVPENQRASLVQRLDRADAALKSGRSYQALYLLEAAAEGASAFAFATSSRVQTLDDFVTTWTRLGVPKPRNGKPGNLVRVPAVIDAIAEAAEDRGPSTYQASRPYAEDAGTDAGLYYLGESRAVMDYAAFIRSLTWSDAGRRPVFRSIAPELSAFDREMTARYETMDRGDHPTYIRASAALKQARSLDEHGALEGSLFQYLLARYLFAPLRGAAAGDPTRGRIDAARATLPPGEDHSIGELFVQFAEEGLSSDSADLRRGAASVIEDVLPAYVAAIAPARPTASSTMNAAVAITLVRWPFT